MMEIRKLGDICDWLPGCLGEPVQHDSNDVGAQAHGAGKIPINGRKANTLVLTSNTPVNNWSGFFEGDKDTLVCTLDRIFDRASVYLMRGPSFHGRDCETLSVEAVPSVSKARR